MTSIGGQTPTYDQNGDVTNDFLNSYSWDANGGPVTVDGVGVTYDALGRIAEADKSGTYYETVYSPAGGKLAVMSGQSLNFALVPLAGGAVAEYHGGGVLYYRHADWLGSGRFVSTTSRTTYADQAYGPFGEPYAGSGTSDLMFTGMDQDTTGNVYDFPEREYGIQGRWPSPDPVGLASVDPTDPQTWNRYAYLRNSPLEGTDPTGTDDCWGMPNGEVNQGTAEYVQCEEEQMFGNSATGNLGSASGSSSDSPLSTENQFQSNYFSASYNGPVYTSATWGAAGITSPNDFIAYGTELTVVGIDDIAYTVKSYFGSCAPSGATLSNSCNAGYQFGKDLGFGESAWEKYVNTVSGSNGQVPKPGTLPAPAFPNTPGLTVPAPLKPTCSVPNVMKLWLQQLKAWLTNNRDSQLPLEFQQPPAWVVSCATP